MAIGEPLVRIDERELDVLEVVRDYNGTYRNEIHAKTDIGSRHTLGTCLTRLDKEGLIEREYVNLEREGGRVKYATITEAGRERLNER